MSKYYMFEIESIVQTFTVLDTGKEISFGYSSAEEQECFKDVNGGDLILGYYNEPIDAVKILFEVKGHLEDTQSLRSRMVFVLLQTLQMICDRRN